MKLSTLLGLITIIQLIYTVGIGLNPEDSMFTLEHEDTIFMMNLMTFFIVKALEDK